MKLIHQITIVILTTLLLVVALVGISMYVSVERGFARGIRGTRGSATGTSHPTTHRTVCSRALLCAATA